MKKFLIVLGAIGLMAVTGAIWAGDKVDICHNGHIINVSVNAIPAHLAHGDTLFTCNPPGCTQINPYHCI